MTSAPRWNLENIYAGGLEGGTPWQEALRAATDAVEALVQQADALPPLPEALEDWSATLQQAYDLVEEIGVVRVFAVCHASADARSPAAQRAQAQTTALWGRLDRAMVPLEDGIATASEKAFAALTSRPELEPMLPRLQWLRDYAHLRLPRAEQALATELARDGIHGWSQLYDRVSGELTVELPGEDGEPVRVGVGQANNRLGDPSPEVRRQTHEALGEAWKTVTPLCASALTHIVGHRQVLNDRRGVDELADALARSRMRQETLDAMHAAARRAGPLLERFLAAKARALGLEQLSWYDVDAPVGSEQPWSWERAASFVVEHFGSWHPELRDFAARAFQERWVEAEDRPGKRQGGWCANVPRSGGTSRVFMTFGGNFRSTTTLAHELGHAFHNWAMRDVPPARRYVPSTLAETASVFAENIVRDAALAAATDKDARLAMLDARLSAGVVFLMNIPFRFELERELYRMRRSGPLDPDALSEHTEALQREAFRGALASWDPLYWATKLHFYISSFAFYNFPYAFGYLFSGLVYQRARAEGAGWHGRYVELLQRTGTDAAEPLAQEFLGLDLTNPDDWYLAIEPLEADLQAFEALIQPTE